MLRPVRRAYVLVLTALLGAGLTAVSAPPASAATSYRLLFKFVSGETLATGTRVVDASGKGHHGVVRAAYGGSITRAPGYGGGVAARFPAKCTSASCPNALIDVPDFAGLDPGYAAFDFGAKIRMKAADTSDGSNLLQKGLHNDPGGQWKLQVDGSGGRPSCVISGFRSGTYRAVEVTSSIAVTDDRWHVLMCRRTSTSVQILIDGVVRGSKAMAPVNLASTARVTVGAKHLTWQDNDQYHGVLDDVWMRLL